MKENKQFQGSKKKGRKTDYENRKAKRNKAKNQMNDDLAELAKKLGINYP